MRVALQVFALLTVWVFTQQIMRIFQINRTSVCASELDSCALCFVRPMFRVGLNV